MAAVDMQTLHIYFGANPMPKVAALTALASLALWADLPELCFLGGLLVYTAASGKSTSVDKWGQAFASNKAVNPSPTQSVAFLVVALLFAAAFDILMGFALALISALSYLALYELAKRQQESLKLKASKAGGKTPSECPASSKLASWRRHSSESPKSPAEPRTSALLRGMGRESNPLADPCAEHLTGVDAEIHELVQSCRATRADDAAVRQLLKMARKCILSVVPEADIQAIPGGNLDLIGASGAKPEVDMIVTVDPQVLHDRLKAHFLKGHSRIQKSLDTLMPELLQKTATKVLSERLTFVRFWRSQFSGPEPMIVLLVPVELGFFNYPLRLNFSVNTPYPLRLATLISKENTRAKELILIVTRWARERCIANQSRGQPHAYAWGLMAIYFLRNGPARDERAEKCTAELFKEFVNFYGDWFERPDDVVSVSFSHGAVQASAESTLWGVPHIEDPFDTTRNAGSAMTAEGVARMKDELARARSMLSADPVKLSDLLERWFPPVQAVTDTP